MKKILSVVLALLMIVSALACFASCGNEETEKKTLTKENIKIGLITLHDKTSTYDKNFIESMEKALEELGIKAEQLMHTSGIDENDGCYDEAVRMAKAGCDVIFADSFGHEPFIVQAAQEYPDIQFAHATGTQAHTANLANFGDAFANIYQGRYLAGIVAGEKLKQMIEAGEIKAEEAIVGYVGAYPYAEVKSGYTSWFLGVRSVVSSATMKVRFTNSWYDTDLEKAAAKALIETDKCVLISQHADSYGAPTACEEAGVPNVSYNGSTEAQGPNTYLVSSKIDWTPYFKHLIETVLSGNRVEADYIGTFETGSVVLLPLSQNCAPGTQEAVDAALVGLKDGSIKVFDTSKFTVNGATLTSYKADVDDAGDYVPETEVIKDGYFHESEFRSAPYFDIDIDGITIINK